MRTEQLHYLMAIQRFKSLNAASQELHITPQALGQAIKALEDELKLELLNRHHNGVRLTAAALELITVGQLFLDNVAYILSKYHPQMDAKELHFLAFAGLIDDLLPEIISAFYNLHPTVKLCVHSAQTKEMPQTVRDGQVEFALYCNTAINGISIFSLPPDLNFTPIASADLVYLVHREHPLAQLSTPISIKTMNAYPILVPYSINMLETMQDLANYYDYHPTIIYESNYNIFKKLLENVSNISFGMEFTQRHKLIIPAVPEHIISLPLAEDIHFLIGYIKQKNRRLSDHALLFLNFLQKYLLTHSTF